MFTLSILLFILLALLLFTISISLLLVFSEPCYCTDSFTDAYNQLSSKISKVEENIQYFSEQAKEADRLFKEALKENLPEDMKQERLEAKKDSEINLNVEKKVLKTLKDRLNSGNFDSSLSTTSSLGKRNFGE